MLKHGLDHNELRELINSVVPNFVDQRALKNKISLFVGFTDDSYNNAVQKDIKEYDNEATRHDFICQLRKRPIVVLILFTLNIIGLSLSINSLNSL